jgi:elongation factor 3
MQDPRLAGLDREEILAVMASVGFTEDGKAKPFHAVSTLSGGWRMKLAMARAMLQKADILLLDEPTNHLDVINVAWVKNYINSLTNVTCIMVSHSHDFLNSCCTDILSIERLKLKHTRGNLEKFMLANPEARAFFSIKESKLKFKFPQPGPIEGVKSRSKALMKIMHSDFTYPGNTVPTLFDISVRAYKYIFIHSRAYRHILNHKRSNSFTHMHIFTKYTQFNAFRFKCPWPRALAVSARTVLANRR